MDSLVDEGFILLGGPLEDERFVLHVVEAPSKEAVHERLAADNWTQDGKHETVSIEAWICPARRPLAACNPYRGTGLQCAREDRRGRRTGRGERRDAPLLRAARPPAGARPDPRRPPRVRGRRGAVRAGGQGGTDTRLHARRDRGVHGARPARALGGGRDEPRAAEGKLEELDERLGLLRTMRAGVLRALDVRWRSLDESTSTAAYLARRGRDPELARRAAARDQRRVGRGTLRETSLAGVALSWDDVLHVGPLAFDPAESRRVRARFLADTAGEMPRRSRAGLERRDELLARAERVVIWFEHDLFDQLQLLQILAQIADGPTSSSSRPTTFSASSTQPRWRPSGSGGGGYRRSRGARRGRRGGP